MTNFHVFTFLTTPVILFVFPPDLSLQIYIPFLVILVWSTAVFAQVYRTPYGHCSKTDDGRCLKLELKNLFPQLVCGILSMSFALRVAWCFVEAAIYKYPFYNGTTESHDYAPAALFYTERVLNRFSMLLMLTSFSLVLLAWLLAAGGSLADWNKCFRWSFAVGNFAIYIITLSTVRVHDCMGSDIGAFSITCNHDIMCWMEHGALCVWCKSCRPSHKRKVKFTASMA